MEENNSVEILAEVIQSPKFNHESHNEKFYNIVVSVKRLSGDTDELEVIIPEKILPEIKAGELYNIIGEVRSYNYYNKENGKRKLLISIYAKELKKVFRENLKPEDECKNDIKLIGYLCKKPVYRKTPFGREISDILLAVNRIYGKSDYLPCIVWGKNARYSSELEVGTKVKITGRMQSRSYNKEIEGKEVKKIAYEISAATFEKLEDEYTSKNDENEINDDLEVINEK